MTMTCTNKKSNQKDDESASAFEHNISNKLTANLIEESLQAKAK